ncbi:MAG: GNAT family N-acetyltransferase [Planctomycetales bacterium]|nr:GNAT family N-acetyltransferase [Planctomycetales bacterium]
MTASPWLIDVCPPHERATALQAIGAGLPAEMRQGLADAVSGIVRSRDSGKASDAIWDGLLVARSRGGDTQPAGTLLGATWVQTFPGRTALVWPPAYDCAAGLALLQAAAQWARGNQVRVAQWLDEVQNSLQAVMLHQAGFRHLADLVYLAAPAVASSNAHLLQGLDFEACVDVDEGRLQEAIQATYRETLDCPELDGVRPLHEVLQGYRAQGHYRPDRWFVLRSGGVDAGVLLLTEYPSTGNWELLYVGLRPEFRGRRWGAVACEFALDCAARGGAERLVVAVDAANSPAISAYVATGFQEWDRRSVYALLNVDSFST